jgi:hypothetical protein
VEVELSRPKFAQLELKTGSVVHLKPRRARVFIDDRNTPGSTRGSIDDREVPRGAPVPADAVPGTDAKPARAA